MVITHLHGERFDTYFLSILVIQTVDEKRNWVRKPVYLIQRCWFLHYLQSYSSSDKNLRKTKSAKKTHLFRMILMRCLLWMQTPPRNAMLESQLHPLLTSTIGLYCAEYVKHYLLTLMVKDWFLRFFFKLFFLIIIHCSFFPCFNSAMFLPLLNSSEEDIALTYVRIRTKANQNFLFFCLYVFYFPEDTKINSYQNKVQQMSAVSGLSRPHALAKEQQWDEVLPAQSHDNPQFRCRSPGRGGSNSKPVTTFLN